MRYYGKIHSKLPIFCVTSVKIYTGQKNLHWRRQQRQLQLSGMHPGAVCCGANKVLATLKKIVFPYYSPNESYLGFRQQLVDKVWVRPLLSGISYTIVSYFNIKGKFGLFIILGSIGLDLIDCWVLVFQSL